MSFPTRPKKYVQSSRHSPSAPRPRALARARADPTQLGHQPRALASAIHAYATNIHDLAPVLPVVERIAHKHASLHIVAAQYGIVGKHLIEAIGAVLGEALTPEIADAWYHGYWNLAKVRKDPRFTNRNPW